jgi:hypothetical protein
MSDTMPQRRSQLVLIALFGMLVLLRIPSLLEGRLWAEDGLFLVDALRKPWWQALTTPHTGYIDVTASTAMLLATRVADLEHVALVSIVVALAVQVCPAILLATSSCAWLQPRWALILALLLVLAPPAAEEIWLSPVTSQYHLAVCAALILAFDGGSHVFRNLLLAVAGLSGPGPVLIAPLFAFRAVIDRSRQRMIQTTLLSTGALIEFVIFCSNPEPNRHLTIDPSLLASTIYVKHLILPFFGRWLAKLAGSDPQPLITLACILGLGVVVLKARGREVRWLYVAALTMMVLSYLGALGNKADLLKVYFGQRYYYAPQVLLGLTLLGVARTSQPVIVHRVTWVLVSWLLAIGAWQYFRINPTMATGPSWHDQVVLWRKDHRAMKVWPATMQIELPST